MTYFSRQYIVHGQNVDLGLNAKGSFYLCPYKLGTVHFQQLIDLALRGRNALKRHIARRAGSAEIRFLVIDSKNYIVDGSANKTIGLAVPAGLV